MSLLVKKVDFATYPELRLLQLPTDRPGLILVERDVMKFLRYSSFLNFAVSPICWLVKRRMAARQGIVARIAVWPLHHFILLGAGYATNVAIGAGVLLSMWSSRSYTCMDHVVYDAIVIRADKVNDRWNKTGARAIAMGAFTTIMMSNYGNLWMRAARGVSLGALVGVLASVSEIDLALEFLTS